MGLSGRTAIVTGAAQGIGAAYAEALAREGASVVCADLQGDGAKDVAARIVDAGGAAEAVGVDVSDRESTLAMADAALAAFGRIDILVNNAAIYHSMARSTYLDADIEYWRKIFSVNLDGALLCAQACAPAMAARGWGRIVNQASIAAFLPHSTYYSLSKLALVGMTVGLATELGPSGITCNAIAPGPIFTEATLTGASESMLDDVFVREQPRSKRLMPEDLVPTLLYLVSDGVDYVTGQTIVVDGGWLKRI